MCEIRNMANEQLAKRFLAIKEVKSIDITKVAATGKASEPTIRKYLKGEIPDSKGTQANEVYLLLTRLVAQRKKQIA